MIFPLWLHQILNQEIRILLRLNASHFLVTKYKWNKKCYLILWYCREKYLCLCLLSETTRQICLLRWIYNSPTIFFSLRSLMSVGLSILIFDVKCSQLQPFFSWLSTFDSFKHPTRDLSRDDRVKNYETKMKFWNGLGSWSCRGKKLPTALSIQLFGVAFSTFLWAKKNYNFFKNILAFALKS